jgi:3-oxoacyl-[acyl-carrier protein] reductase
MANEMSWAGKKVVVLGGSGGLGRGIVEAFAGAKASVLAVARDRAKLEKLAGEVPGVRVVAGDAADEGLAARIVGEETPDVVVSAVGASPGLAPIHEQTWETFARNWEVDVKSAFVWLREALRRPLRRGSHVVVVSSGAAIAGSPVSGGYAGAKRTQWFVADYAAKEVARLDLGIQVHCLLPSLNPSSELGRAGIAAYAERSGISAEEFEKRLSPVLTPAVMGRAVLDVCEDPERSKQLAWRVSGKGLEPVA